MNPDNRTEIVSKQYKVFQDGTIMMRFTKDGQIHPELLKERDKRFNVSTVDKEKACKHTNPQVDPMANAWGKAI